MMHVAHVKSSIEIDCTTEMSFLYRYRSPFVRVRRRKKRSCSPRPIRVVYLTPVTPPIKFNVLALQIARDQIWNAGKLIHIEFITPPARKEKKNRNKFKYFIFTYHYYICIFISLAEISFKVIFQIIAVEGTKILSFFAVKRLEQWFLIFLKSGSFVTFEYMKNLRNSKINDLKKQTKTFRVEINIF